MLVKHANQGGWSLIELIIGIAIVAITVAAATPSISAWINNSQIRTAAESIQNGLQLARAEAVRRNTSISFYLTDRIDNSCALSGTSATWVVAIANPVGACANDTNVLARYTNLEGGSLTSVFSPQTTITFNGLGRATTGNNTICVGITGVASSCTATKPENQLAIQVGVGGQIRMCSNARPVGDPQRC